MNELNAWLKDRPKWLQEGARLLLTKGRLTADKLFAHENRYYTIAHYKQVLPCLILN